ncbi:MAG: hypothetical protein JXQ65_09375 [Candidatus Marinimicrobia bacterium]|nr:hypothetical protein [Candidatus Neomarinimicrobiota bacterium]
MKYNKYLTISLLSISLIAMEMAWTRIFSAEFFYTFAFLILSLAVLGLGLGSLSLRFFKFLNRESNFPNLLVLTAVAMFLGPILIFKLNIQFTEVFSDALMVLKLLAAILILNSSYFLGGIGLALIIKIHHKDIDRLYMADMISAGIGIIGIILMMNLIGTPAATFLVPLPVLLAAFLASKKYFKIIPVAVMLAILGSIPFSEQMLQVQRKERAEIEYSHWDAIAKIKIYNYAENYKGINIDNAANSPCYGFDGKFNKPDSELYDFGIDVRYLMDLNKDCCFLSLGAGGGVDVLQALQYGAKEIHAVEVIPHINQLMTKGYLAEFSGNIYQDPRVKVVTEDARIYVRQFENKFDLIYSLSANSFAAMASGSFALAENYLFTTEAFMDYWKSLTPTGFLMMEHQFYIPRLISEVQDALIRLGVKTPRNHYAVYNLPNMRRKIILMSKQPLSMDIIENAFGHVRMDEHNWVYPIYPVTIDSLHDPLILNIVEKGWRTAAAQAPFDISPTTDNRPFAAQMGLWKNFSLQKLDKILPYEFFGFPLSKVIISIILIIVFVVIIPVNLVPYIFSKEKLKLVPWIYFFMIGLGFMMVEVILIQQYALLTGSTIFSIISVLISLLLFSGIGSRFSTRFNPIFPFAMIFLWLLLNIILFPALVDLLGGLRLFLRILSTILLIAPLGFFMGMPFPKAGSRVGALIDWGFAVNGAASTLGAVLVLLIAFSWGYSISLVCAGFCYLAAGILFNLHKAW